MNPGIGSILRRIKGWTAPPIFPGDDDKTLRAARLNISLNTILTLGPLLFVGGLIGGRTPLPVFAANLAGVVMVLFARRWMHRGRIGLASVWVLTVAIAAVTAGSAALGTIRSPTTAIYVLAVITGGLLFEFRGVLVTTGVCAAAVAGLAVAERAGVLPRPDFTVTITQWISYAGIFGWAGSLTYAALRQIHAGVDRMKAEAVECRLAEEALRESEERFRLANLATNDVIWDWDIVNDTQRWNKEGAVVFGWSDIVERPQNAVWWVERVHPEDRQWVEAGFFAVVNDPQAEFWRAEYRFLKTDGSYVQVADRGYVLRDADGRAVRMIGAMLDITARKRAEAALRESEERNRSVLENSLDGILLTAPDGRIFNANPVACRMFGRTEEEIRRIGRSGIIDASDPQLARAVEERARTGRFRGELTGLRKDGTKFPVEVSTSVFVDREGQPRTSMTIRDVTERRRAEDALRIQEAIVRTMAEGVCLIRASDGVIIYSNPRFESMFGYGPGEMNGLPVHRVNAVTDGRTAESVARAIIAELERSGEAVYEILNVRKDGTPFWCRAHTTTLDHPELGRVWVAVHEDITERKRAEEELGASRDELRSLSAKLESAREEEKASVAREIHDELGQRLTGLIMDLSMLEKKIPDSLKPLKERAAAMIDEAGALVKTVRRIATSLRPGILDDMGLVAAIEWQVEDFASRTGIPSSCDCRGFSGEIDPARAIGVFRILQEALTNIARHARARSVRVEFREESVRVVLRVEDDGRGISPAEVSGRGTLGLAGMRERARLLGGEISVNGSPGKGTSVELMFPREAGRS